MAKTIRKSYTLLRPRSFTQYTLMAAPTVASEGRIYQPMKSGGLGMTQPRRQGRTVHK
jgi:hypothetical protein